MDLANSHRYTVTTLFQSPKNTADNTRLNRSADWLRFWKWIIANRHAVNLVVIRFSFTQSWNKQCEFNTLDLDFCS